MKKRSTDNEVINTVKTGEKPRMEQMADSAKSSFNKLNQELDRAPVDDSGNVLVPAAQVSSIKELMGSIIMMFMHMTEKITKDEEERKRQEKKREEKERVRSYMFAACIILVVLLAAAMLINQHYFLRMLQGMIS